MKYLKKLVFFTEGKKNIKMYEDRFADVVYSVGDVVVCSTKNDRYHNYQGYINQDDVFVTEEGEPVYGQEYEVIRIYWYGREYSTLNKIYYYTYRVDVKDLNTEKFFKNLDASLFTLSSKWIKPDEPMIGDYVICKTNKFHSEDLNDFLKINIGLYSGYARFDGSYTIRYINIPKNLKYAFWGTFIRKTINSGHINMNRNEILHYSPNKEDLNIYLDLQKYNL